MEKKKEHVFLHNRTNRIELTKNMQKRVENYIVYSFYKYYPIKDVQKIRDSLYIELSKLNVLGRIYLSNEGINAQVSLPISNVKAFKNHLKTINFLDNVFLNEAIDSNQLSFIKLQIKIRKKIVTDGITDQNFNPAKIGTHLDAESFNQFWQTIDDNKTILVDMRNHYESEVGHFQKAILPDVDTFQESIKVTEKILNDKKKKNIILYCTGGIRCEKASAYLKHKGFQNVYQLKGGIINYVREAKRKKLTNLFIGKNFVFDQRLGERITNDIISRCHQCHSYSDRHTNCDNDACHLLFIQCDSCAEIFYNCCSKKCYEVTKLPETEQRLLRKKINKGMQVYKKGRHHLDNK